jgi:hypothetical protein
LYVRLYLANANVHAEPVASSRRERSNQSTVASYQYDANGNMICRLENGAIYK